MMWVCVKDLDRNYISLLKVGIALCKTIHEVRKDRHVSHEYLDNSFKIHYISLIGSEGYPKVSRIALQRAGLL